MGFIGDVVGGIMGSNSAKKSAKAQENAAREAAGATMYAADNQYELGMDALNFEKQVYNEVKGYTEPYRDAGEDALMRLESLLYGIPIEETSSYQATGQSPGGMEPGDMYDFTTTPGYEFRRDEGQKALERSATGRSGLLSGAQLKATERYAQDYATSEYDNVLRRLGGLVDTGMTATGQASNNALSSASNQSSLANSIGQGQLQAGQNQANALYGIGAAQASGYQSINNANQNLLSSIGQATGSIFGSFGGIGGGGTPIPGVFQQTSGGFVY
jgi:hypothetical protein